MTATEIFEELLKDSILVEDYGLTIERLEQMSLHRESGSDIVEVLKLLVKSVEGNTPNLSVNSMVKTHFKI